MSPRKKSYLTVTDQFCGAGGSSIGAAEAGLEIRMAMNHWKLAVDTHNTNFPDADHDCADISASDPRRYPSTDILITSPECTTHSPAGGNKHRRSGQHDMFVPTELDPATQRSRATMWDVVRFTEYHKYRAVIVENVVEVLRWELFSTWWQAMEHLGFVGKIVSLNSMFAHPTPQSRDRIYIIWTRKGNKRPDLSITPVAPCVRCGTDVEARQTWKNGNTVGKYGDKRQYVYTCPTCRTTVMPYYFCALNALDFSIPAVRIGDRPVPLKPKTLARVRFGLEKYGRRVLQVTTNNISGLGCRVREAEEPLFGQTTSNTTAIVAPWMFGLAQSSAPPESIVRSGGDPLRTQTTCDDAAVAGFMPFMYVARENTQARALDDPLLAMVASANQLGVVQPSALFNPFLVTLRTNANGKALDEPLPAVCTSPGHHAVIQPAALVRLMGDRAVSTLDQVVPTQSTGASQNMLVSPSPFLVQYYGQGTASAVDDSLPSVTTKDRHALVDPQSLDVEDCYFRMMASREIGRAMAFPGSYMVLGTNGEQIKQYGNAVTPPAMKLLIKRVRDSITGERAA